MSHSEKNTIQRLIEGLDNYDKLMQQLESALVCKFNSDGSILEVCHKGYTRDGAGQMPIGRQGTIHDSSGHKHEVVVYVDRNGMICEIEYVPISESLSGNLDYSTFAVNA